MAILEIPQTQQKLNKFAAEQWDPALAFLQGTFSLSRSDCEDIFIESFSILKEKINEGKVQTLTRTFFFTICKNKAHEKIRDNSKYIHSIDDFPGTIKDEYEDERIDRILALEDDTNNFVERKEALVREIVKNLPDPCDKLLWGFFRDGFSLRTLASLYNKTEGYVKVTSFRCRQKFKARYLELSKYLFD